jgi:tellurite resistance protein TerC
MLIVEWFKIPVAVSLGVVVAVIGTSILLSLIATRNKQH